MEKKKKDPIKIVNENNKKGKPTKIILTEEQVKRIMERLKNEIMK
jgi:hypothetical protein